MWGFNTEIIQMLLILAAFAEAIVLGITVLVLYKNLTTIKSQNEKMFSRFEFQSTVERYDLTLKFTDWVKSELQDYLPYALGTVKQGQLTKIDIKEHFDYIAKNMISLVKNEVIFIDLARDEIKKLSDTIYTMDDNDPMVMELNKLLGDNSV